jgi:hypothetical protein
MRTRLAWAVIHVVPSRSAASTIVAPPAAIPPRISRAPDRPTTSGAPNRGAPRRRVLAHSPNSPSTATIATMLTAIHGPSNSHGGVALLPSIVTGSCTQAPNPTVASRPRRNSAAECLNSRRRA